MLSIKLSSAKFPYLFAQESNLMLTCKINNLATFQLTILKNITQHYLNLNRSERFVKQVQHHMEDQQMQQHFLIH